MLWAMKETNMTTTMKINVSLNSRDGNPYVGKITGRDAKFGFALDFLPLARKSAKYHTAEIAEAGDYKVLPGSTVGTWRVDTGYVRIGDDGSVTEISKQDAEAAL